MYKILCEVVAFCFHTNPQTIRQLINCSTVSIGIDDAARTKDFLRLSKFLWLFDRPCSPTLTTNCCPMNSNLHFQTATHLLNQEYRF